MAVLLALGSALAYAGAAVLQQRAARAVPQEHALRLGLLWHLVRRPLWLAGTAADWVGYGLQALALGIGSLLVVQPALCTGLLFALPIGAAWQGRRLGRVDWGAALALTGGLATFLLVGRPSEGKAFPSGEAWLVAAALVGPAVVLSTIGGVRARGSRRAVLLSLATAILYAITAVNTKAAVTLLGDGLHAFFTAWEPYAGVAAALLGLVLNQSAFQAGELEASLPLLTAVEPVVASVLGAFMLDEAIQAHGSLQWSAVVLATLVMLAAVWVLARSAARAEAAVDVALAEARPVPPFRPARARASET